MLLNNYANRHDLLIDWMLESLRPGAAVIEIGPGDGTFCPETRRIRERVSYYAGVDPDAEKLAQHKLLDACYPTRLEQADVPTGSFDGAFASYVFEHVPEPMRFLQSASRVLKPGGSLFFITPNLYHYFAIASRLTGSVGLQERVLRWLRPSSLVERYHSAAFYLMNSPRKISDLASSSGFEKCEFRFCEKIDEFLPYFPGFSKLMPYGWEMMVRALGTEWLLGNLMGRMIAGARV